MIGIRFILPIVITLLISCGGGGGSEKRFEISGKFISSYVKGLKVCIEEENLCTQTQDDGSFKLFSSFKDPMLSFYIDKVLFGKYRISSEGEVISPFKLSSSQEVGDALAKLIHGLVKDVSGDREIIDLTEIDSIWVEPKVSSITKALEMGEELTVNVLTEDQEYKLKVSKGKVELCQDNKCIPVNYRQWLFLVFMDGDNVLNDYAYQDLEELEKVEYSPQVKVVVLADFLDEGRTLIAISDEKTGKLSYLEEMYEVDMGSAQTLKDFVRTFMELYPSPKVALIFWNHGDGWRSSRSAAYDESSNSHLFMYRVVEALRELKTQGFKLNLIGFDECLMGMAEVFFDVGQFSDAVVASETLEPAGGWNYERVLKGLVQKPQIGAYDLGKLIVDAYRESYSNLANKTMIVLSKDEMEKLIKNINSLSNRLDRTNFQLFKLARERTSEIPDGENGALFYVDLYSLMNNLEGFQEANEIKSLIDNAYKFSSSKELHGVSIYFPKYKDDPFLSCYLKSEPSEPINCFNDPYYYNPFTVNLWDDFLSKYFQIQEKP